MQLWRTSQPGIDVGPRRDAYCHISAQTIGPTKWSPRDARRDGRARFSVDRALIVARNRFHYRFYVFSDLTSIGASPTRLGLVFGPSLTRYNDRSTTLPTDSVVGWWQLARPPDDRSLIHIFSTWLSSSSTCNTVIHQALTVALQYRAGWPAIIRLRCCTVNIRHQDDWRNMRHHTNSKILKCFSAFEFMPHLL